jgi:hypothetical protein
MRLSATRGMGEVLGHGFRQVTHSSQRMVAIRPAMVPTTLLAEPSVAEPLVTKCKG